MQNVDPSKPFIALQPSPKLGEWLWRPMRAKLWWMAMPFYWGGMLASLRIEALSTFYHSAVAGIANVFFFPPLVALILSYGFFKARLAKAEFGLDGDAEEILGMRGKRYGPSGTLREFDPHDPVSGSNWIGSPLNPSHPFYVIRHRHSS